jgi:hypothetical protein
MSESGVFDGPEATEPPFAVFVRRREAVYGWSLGLGENSCGRTANDHPCDRSS